MDTRLRLRKYLVGGAMALGILATPANALQIVGQIDMTGVAEFDAPLATATQVSQWSGTRAVIGSGTFAAGGVVGDPLTGGLFSSVQTPWMFSTYASPLWVITGSQAPNTTFTFEGLKATHVNQVSGFLEILGTGLMKSSDPAYDDTPCTWRFTTQGTGSSVNRYSFSASALMTAVPDGAVTVGLLGMALMGIEGLRRRLDRRDRHER